MRPRHKAAENVRWVRIRYAPVPECFNEAAA